MDPEREQPSKQEVENEPSQPHSFGHGAKSNVADCDEEDLQSETIRCESKRMNNSLAAREWKSSPIPIRRSRRGHTSQETPKKLELDQDNHVGTHFPFFFVEMKRSNVIAGFWLTIPSEFSSKHLPNKDGPIILRDAQGHKWDTKYLTRKNALSAGWSRFAVHHRLELGDDLVFELVKPLEFLVHITKVSKCKRDGVVPAASNPAPDSNSPHTHSSPRKRMKIDHDTQDNASIVDQRRVTTRDSQKVNAHSLFHMKTRRTGSGRF